MCLQRIHLVCSLGLLLLCGSSSVAWAVPIEWTVASGGNGHFYEAVDLGIEISWDDAKGASNNGGLSHAG